MEIIGKSEVNYDGSNLNDRGQNQTTPSYVYYRIPKNENSIKLFEDLDEKKNEKKIKEFEDSPNGITEYINS